MEGMYHSYDGGGVQVTGPAIFAYKSLFGGLAANAEYYVDAISAASVDVVTSASPYDETRTEVSLGLDWLYRDSVVSVGYTGSEENDYEADTYSLGVSQEVFNGMSTINMGYSHGDDVVTRVDNDFEDSVDRDNYALGLNQVLTPTLVASLDYEAVLEDGFLANPYRSARILGAQIPERYPRTRTSHAASLTAVKAWDVKTALRARYRYFTDTWDIQAHDLEFGFSRYITDQWIADLSYRYYTQDAASFYSDDFDQEYNYMARDKELSTFNSHSFGGRLSWIFKNRLPVGLHQAGFTFSYEYLMFSYDDFTDIRTGDQYEFNSQVFQLYFSARY